MEQINFSNKRLVSDAGETKTYLIDVNGTDIRVYESTKTNRFGFNMKDLAKAFNYETVEEFQASEQWKEFSSQISENLKKNTGNEEDAQIGKVSDVIGDVSTASPVSAKSTNATSQWVERAGINGALTSPDDVFLYGGGTLDEAVAGVTPILFRADGSGHVANQNVSWDALGNLLVRGIFESNKDGNRVIIDPQARSIKMISSDDFEVFSLTFTTDSVTGYITPNMILKSGTNLPDGNTIEILGRSIYLYTGTFADKLTETVVSDDNISVWKKDKGLISLDADTASIKIFNYANGRQMTIEP